MTTKIPTEFIEDDRLSSLAKYIIFLYFCYQEPFKGLDLVRVKGLIYIGRYEIRSKIKESNQAIRKALQELINLGYIQYEIIQE